MKNRELDHRDRRVLGDIAKIRCFREEQVRKEQDKSRTPIKPVTRLGFTEHEDRAFDYVSHSMKQIGLEVRIDSFGNLYGRLEGTKPNAKAILIGSHVDSVRQGGAYDGVFGVSSCLEAVRRLREEKVTLKHPIEIVVWRCEESSRFGKALLGSAAATGKLTEEDLTRVDPAKKTLKEELERRELTYVAGQTTIDPSKILAYIEPHVEQGPVLQSSAFRRIGIVDEIAGPQRIKLTFKTTPAHSGATPMNMRQNALIPAARTVAYPEKAARRKNFWGRLTRKPRVVSSATIVDVENANLNTIPGTVNVFIDTRSASKLRRNQTNKAITTFAARKARKTGAGFASKEISSSDPTPLDRTLARELSSIAKKIGVNHRIMTSGPSHDAANMQLAGIPSTVIFIPSEGAHSHNPHEKSLQRDIGTATKLLTEFLKRKAS